MSRRADPEGVERRAVRLVELRVEDGDGGTRIEGHAAIFNSLSEDLGGFREVIEPGFFEGVVGNDVRALWNHNDDLVLGRTRSGTLRVEEDEVGLAISADPPDTTWARDALVTMQRGDVDQMSFAFRVREGGDDWRREPDGMLIRTLRRGGCARLYDVSPVTFPAYPATSVAVRSHVQSLQEGQDPAAGQGAGGEGQEQGDSARARLDPGPTRGSRVDLLRRRLDLAELL